ncbi:DEAD/DEAH box helicase [Pseudarthrobacter sp. SSS035]|uniref:DEAD/DEAH box helicase n=1 Tax=Pseudarthrobacter sp. SSS035 TaxID=2931399 RepID=UPI00200E9F1E|nr:DEAD/DEAH box helicase family protein [Pseudarthrobacter sp. SSS035]
MKFKLRGYQAVAKRHVLEDIVDALERYVDSGGERVTAVQLTAPTGSGKTVIASAVIESALFGADDFAPNPDWTFLWISDDPSLNEQTSRKFLTASDKISHGTIEIIESSFDQKVLDGGKVYFLNVQKLNSSARLSKEGQGDLREYSFWSTLTNTIEMKPDKLVIMIDEAHVGMKMERSRDTIVSRIIGGAKTGRPPAPVIVGITATPKRFERAMDSIDRRVRATRIGVDQVQESGLLKDGLVLASPEQQAANFNESALLRHAVATVRRYEQEWASYSAQNNEPQVLPALVIQVPNTPSDDEMASIIGVVLESWPGLKTHNICHTFGDHNVLNVGNYSIPYSNPEDIQDDLDIRVVLCKQAITTGWDCPRAEVLLSYRKVEDQDAITQIIGRMIRTPLARRVQQNEALNYVHCFLPRFNKAGVKQIADRLKLGDDSFRQEWVHPESMDQNTLPELVPAVPSTEMTLAGSTLAKRATTVNTGLREELLRRREAEREAAATLFGDEAEEQIARPETTELADPKEELIIVQEEESGTEGGTGVSVITQEAVRLTRNPLVNTGVFEKLLELPSYVIPGVQYRTQVDRLKNFATLLTGGGRSAILQGASKMATDRLLQVLRETRVQLDASRKFQEQSDKLAHFFIENEVTTLFDGSAVLEIDSLEEVEIDSKGVEQLFAQAERRIGRSMADSYLNDRFMDDGDTFTMMMSVAVVAHQPGIKEKLEQVANATIIEWFKEYQTQINKAPAALKAQLDEVRSEATEPEASVISLTDNKPFPVAEVVWPKHLLSSPTGDYPVKLNEWEIHVLDTELQDSSCLAWYRNPSSGSGALTVPYVMAGRHRGLTPDFVFFHQTDDGIVPSILDPHAQSLSDSIPKLRGLAKYAAMHGDQYQRIESIIKINDVFYALNLKDSTVQSAVLSYTDARPEALYLAHAGKY